MSDVGGGQAGGLRGRWAPGPGAEGGPWVLEVGAGNPSAEAEAPSRPTGWASQGHGGRVRSIGNTVLPGWSKHQINTQTHLFDFAFFYCHAFICFYCHLELTLFYSF